MSNKRRSTLRKRFVIILAIILIALLVNGCKNSTTDQTSPNMDSPLIKANDELAEKPKENITVITDIVSWEHPIKEYFYDLTKIEMENSTYPIFYLARNTFSKEVIINEFLDGTYNDMLSANGYWDFQIRTQDGMFLKIKGDKHKKDIISIILNGDPIDLETIQREYNLVEDMLLARIIKKVDETNFYYFRNPYTYDERPKHEGEYYLPYQIDYLEKQNAFTIALPRKTDTVVTYLYSKIESNKAIIYFGFPSASESPDNDHVFNTDFQQVKRLLTERYFIVGEGKKRDFFAHQSAPEDFIYKVEVADFDIDERNYLVEIIDIVESESYSFLYYPKIDKFISASEKFTVEDILNKLSIRYSVQKDYSSYGGAWTDGQFSTSEVTGNSIQLYFLGGNIAELAVLLTWEGSRMTDASTTVVFDEDGVGNFILDSLDTGITAHGQIVLSNDSVSMVLRQVEGSDIVKKVFDNNELSYSRYVPTESLYITYDQLLNAISEKCKCSKEGIAMNVEQSEGYKEWIRVFTVVEDNIVKNYKVNLISGEIIGLNNFYTNRWWGFTIDIPQRWEDEYEIEEFEGQTRLYIRTEENERIDLVIIQPFSNKRAEDFKEDYEKVASRSGITFMFYQVSSENIKTILQILNTEEDIFLSDIKAIQESFRFDSPPDEEFYEAYIEIDNI
jgi:hypothetical protein